MEFLINFWPPVKEYWPDMLDIAKEHFKVNNVTHYRYNGSDWTAFIMDFYRFCWEKEEHDIRPNVPKMIPKAQYMKQFSEEIYLVNFEVEDPIFDQIKNGNPYGVKEIKQLKEEIRAKYKTKAPRFSIVHSFDTPARNKQIIDFLEHECMRVE